MGRFETPLSSLTSARRPLSTLFCQGVVLQAAWKLSTVIPLHQTLRNHYKPYKESARGGGKSDFAETAPLALATIRSKTVEYQEVSN